MEDDDKEEDQLPQFFIDIENSLKDHCAQFLVIMRYEDEIYRIDSSDAFSYGAAVRHIKMLENMWKAEDNERFHSKENDDE